MKAPEECAGNLLASHAGDAECAGRRHADENRGYEKHAALDFSTLKSTVYLLRGTIRKNR